MNLPLSANNGNGDCSDEAQGSTPRLERHVD